MISDKNKLPKMIPLGQAKDLTKEKFEKLQPLYRCDTPEGRPKKGTYWVCQCDCGNIHYAASYHLLRGSVQSCGCIEKSLGEYTIANIFKNNNIYFEEQKKYDDCIFQDTKAKARYDFYLPKYNCLIEYDGIQHFKYFDDYDWNDKENFEKVQVHDSFKNQYCFDHNTPLIRIPYTHLNNITLDDLLPATSQFLMKATE